MATPTRRILLTKSCPLCVPSKRVLQYEKKPFSPALTRSFSISPPLYREHTRQSSAPQSRHGPPTSAFSHAQPRNATRARGPALSRKQVEGLVKRALDIVHPLRGETRTDQALFKTHSPAELARKYTQFVGIVMRVIEGSTVSDPHIPSIKRMESVAAVTGVRGLTNMFYYGFSRFVGVREGEVNLDSKLRAADARYPQEWYPRTRRMQRTWHLHIGPTNSGKTYHALKRLEESGNGIYAGPLRLLASEIFERMNAKGIACNLITGDDVRIVDPNAKVKSSTMEMVDVHTEVDVCVIDEIQMIGDPERGWAWTQALLGVNAKEVHMCGEERVVPLIRQLIDTVGDKLVIHSYKRLGPLRTMRQSLGGDLTKIEKGDCLVTFSRRNIFALKRSVEEQTGFRCAVVYGSLPPETRSSQARLFNDRSSEYDVLVASDAVGMGLNLAIKRIIFEAVEKSNGREIVPIEVPQIKQIAGRAGRYRVAVTESPTTDQTVAPLPAAPSVGFVTTLEKTDLKALQHAMKTEVQPLQSAGIRPTVQQIEQFVEQFPPEVPFSECLTQLALIMPTSNLFHVCSFDDQIEIAKNLDHIKNLTVADRMNFLQAPAGRRTDNTLEMLKEMAEAYAKGGSGSIMSFKSVDFEALDQEGFDIDSLRRLESLHKVLIMYLWLSYRFPVLFHPRETAVELKTLCESRIQQCLNTIRFNRKRRRGERPNIIMQKPETEKVAEEITDRGPEYERLKPDSVFGESTTIDQWENPQHSREQIQSI